MLKAGYTYKIDNLDEIKPGDKVRPKRWPWMVIEVLSISEGKIKYEKGPDSDACYWHYEPAKVSIVSTQE